MGDETTDTSAPLILGICLAIALALFLAICIWVCKDLCHSWHLVRERNRNNSEDELDAQAIEMLPQNFEQVARAANVLANVLTARHQENPRQDNTGNVDSDGNNSDDQIDQLDTTFSGDDNETETGSVRNVRRKRRVTFNLEDEGDSSKDKKDGKSSSPGKSSLKSSSSSEGTVDKVEVDTSKYETASGSSSGGGDARATSPWAEFE